MPHGFGLGLSLGKGSGLGSSIPYLSEAAQWLTQGLKSGTDQVVNDRINPLQVDPEPDYVANAAIELNGTDTLVRMTDPVNLSTIPFAISAQIKMSATPAYDSAIYADWESGGLSLLMRADSATGLLEQRWSADGSAASEIRAVYADRIDDGEWHDCLVLKAENCLNVYVDGVLGFGIVAASLETLFSSGNAPTLFSRTSAGINYFPGQSGPLSIAEMSKEIDLQITGGQSNDAQDPADPDFAMPDRYGTNGKQIHRGSFNEDNQSNKVIDGNLVSLNTVGHDVFLGEILSRETKRQHAFVRCAQGGSNMASWQPGETRYNYFRDTINESITAWEAKGYTIRNVYFYWYQGEADRHDLNDVNAWQQGFYDLVDGLQEDTGLAFRQCVIERLHADIGGTYLAEMRAAQVKTATDRGYGWTDADDNPLQPDMLHQTAEGFRLGAEKGYLAGPAKDYANLSTDYKFLAPFTEGYGSTSYDVSGNDNHGTLIGADIPAARIQSDDVEAWNIKYGFRLAGDTASNPRIPALIDGSAAADGNAITNPGGVAHNAAEAAIEQQSAGIVTGCTADDGASFDGLFMAANGEENGKLKLESAFNAFIAWDGSQWEFNEYRQTYPPTWDTRYTNAVDSDVPPKDGWTDTGGGGTLALDYNDVFLTDEVGPGEFGLVSDGLGDGVGGTPQYIDTEVVSGDIDFEISFKSNDLNPSSDKFVLAGNVEGGDVFFYVFYNNSANAFEAQASTIEQNNLEIGPVTGTLKKVEKVGNEYFLDGQSVGTLSNTFDPGTETVLLFGGRYNPSGKYFDGVVSRLVIDSSCNMWAVPKGFRATGAAAVATSNCMWCSVRERYFENDGTGSLGAVRLA